ncbi:MAG TPA: sigma-70 family RNA polymerase sigma factor [Pyrinomonadaceae bacterium]|nr:sigma-70 family RNA polymerase sigma factor [Pyrinomonadaceae bacterium]
MLSTPSAARSGLLMTTISKQEITGLLADWGRGDRAALDKLTPLVYAELRRIARRQMSHERDGHTLQATALVNEAFIRISGQENFSWQNRAHFYAVCAQVMRHILIDHARAQQRDKRGGGAIHVSLDEAAVLAGGQETDFLALDDALRALEAFDPQKGRIVELRYFAGLSIEETAEVLQISPTTVRREWRRAKAWLYRALAEGGGDETRPLATN